LPSLCGVPVCIRRSRRGRHVCWSRTSWVLGQLLHQGVRGGSLQRTGQRERSPGGPGVSAFGKRHRQWGGSGRVVVVSAAGKKVLGATLSADAPDRRRAAQNDLDGEPIVPPLWHTLAERGFGPGTLPVPSDIVAVVRTQLPDGQWWRQGGRRVERWAGGGPGVTRRLLQRGPDTAEHAGAAWNAAG